MLAYIVSGLYLSTRRAKDRMGASNSCTASSNALRCTAVYNAVVCACASAVFTGRI